MPSKTVDLVGLLDSLDPDFDLVHRHLWLIALTDWIRGAQDSPADSAARVDMLLDILEVRPQAALRVQAFWRSLLSEVDGSLLLSDHGFASRNAFLSELVQRLNKKWLPSSPQTSDASELFDLVMPTTMDARWLASLSPHTLQRLAVFLSAPATIQQTASRRALTHWQTALLDAMTFCTSQIRATGFSPEVRLRMDASARDRNPFHTLASSFDLVREQWLAGEDVTEAARAFKLQLEACRNAAATVYNHLDAHGISVDLVFRLRQLRERVLRVRALLDCLLDDPDHLHSAKLLSQLAELGHAQRSVAGLVNSSASLLAAKVAERNSETGEHYITRDHAEYRKMVGNAAGGGALTAITTALKFAVMACGLSAFWYGFWSGVVYAVSFVVIQLLHFTLATKQPAMTAPAMAAKLKDMNAPGALDAFVDEVTHLVRSQTAAVLGNVAVVFPATLVLALVVAQLRGAPMIDQATAGYVLHSLSLLGPSVLYAAFTGVLLFASSILGGWAENWFVLHRLDSAIRYNPRITAVLGVPRAQRWAGFWRVNISGFASNISLGFMLGLVPSVMAFLAIPLDARHVTLSAGQIGAACASIGWDVVYRHGLWWAVASLPVIGLMNVGVSFYFAFRVALRAHDVSDVERSRIYGAITARLRTAPLRFLWPARV